MNHGSQFQQLWRKLCSEVLALQRRGYYGDGAYTTCGSGVSRTFLNAVPFPTFHRFYSPSFLVSDPSGCMIMAWPYFLFQILPHSQYFGRILSINCEFLPRELQFSNPIKWTGWNRFLVFRSTTFR